MRPLRTASAQTGLALVKGKHYTGRIWLRGTPGAQVKVALVWGDGAANRQTVTIPITAAYTKYPLHFTAAADAADAAIEITGTGKGDFHIGAVSLMPADNIHGFRPDTIALLKQIKSGFWRFGGNYTANYTWYDAIGDPDKRPPDWDYAWNQMQPNDLGPDEFAGVLQAHRRGAVHQRERRPGRCAFGGRSKSST